jgi:hypothetical protein
MEIVRFEDPLAFEAQQELFRQRFYSPGKTAAIKRVPVNASCFHCGIVIRDGNDFGLAAIYINPVLFAQKNSPVFFGNFECVNNKDISSRLFTELELEAQKLGGKKMVGPINGSTWDSYKWAVNGFDKNYLTDLDHLPYYSELAVHSAYTVYARYHSQLDNELSCDGEKFAHALQKASDAGFTFRNIDLAKYEQELVAMYSFCLDAFAGNFLYSPVSLQHFLSMYLPLKQLINPDHVILAESADNKICGMIFSLGNIFDKKEKGMVIKTLARSPGKATAGLGGLLSAMLYTRLRQNGYTYAIHAFMHEQNASQRLSVNFSGLPFKEYALFEKSLDTTG